MVMLWRSDAGGVMRSTYKAMRAAHDGALDSLVGPELGEVRAAIGQEPRFRATCEGLFYTGMHYALAANGLTWQDGGELKGWRMDDQRLSASVAPESWHKAWGRVGSSSCPSLLTMRGRSSRGSASRAWDA